MDSATQPSCFNCDLRPDRVFCDLPADALQAFDSIKSVALVPRGDMLFSEGCQPRGAFILCNGRAKLSVCSDNGKRLMLRVAGPGEVLGLSASISGKPYEVTAEMMDSSQVAYIRRRSLVHFLREHSEACLQVVHLLSQDVYTAYERLRSVGLGHSRRPKLVRARA